MMSDLTIESCLILPKKSYERLIKKNMFLSFSFVGNTEIDVDIKRYYCKAGIKSIQVRKFLFV